MSTEAVIVSAARTAVAREGGALRELAPELYGGVVIAEALRRAEVEGGDVDDVIFGNVLAGGGNIARLALLEAGLPVDVAGMTVDRQCASGSQAIALASDLVAAGRGSIYVAGGSESMTRAPYLMARPESAFGRTPPAFVRQRLSPERIGDPTMGQTAENVARRYGVGREEQDQFALRSQQRAAAALADGRFKEQIVPLEVPVGRGETRLFEADEHPRSDTTLERLARLRPAFAADGTVTAGNASGINDGAAAVVVMARGQAERRRLRPLGRVVEWAVAGVDPGYMGMGPVPAVRRALERAGLRLDEIDLVELNEAFASQAVACIRELGLDPERVNVSGGAIALGHPLGATGAILTIKLLSDLRRTGGRRGIVTACIGGGQGFAAVVEA
ncbi:MAG TPA: thiolase family protein, partial [Chloroflexota bacterium]